MAKNKYQGLSEAQIAKVKSCRTQDELLMLAKDEGIELNDEQLEAVSGGLCTGPTCPNCQSKDTKHVGNYTALFECQDCKTRF